MVSTNKEHLVSKGGVEVSSLNEGKKVEIRNVPIWERKKRDERNVIRHSSFIRKDEEEATKSDDEVKQDLACRFDEVSCKLKVAADQC